MNKLNQLYELQEKMQMLELQVNETENLDQQEQLMKEADHYYVEYWELLCQGVDRSVLKEIEYRIGKGHFTERIYLDTLYELIQK